MTRHSHTTTTTTTSGAATPSRSTFIIPSTRRRWRRLATAAAALGSSDGFRTATPLGPLHKHHAREPTTVVGRFDFDIAATASATAGDYSLVTTKCLATATVDRLNVPSLWKVDGTTSRYGGRANHNNRWSSSSCSSSQLVIRSSSQLGSTQSRTMTEEQDQEHRVLGFSDERLERSLTTSTLTAIDKSRWKAAREFEQQSILLGETGNSPIQNNQLAGGFNKNANVNVPAWFPWIPTRAQIHMLKVPELKEICKERSLQRTGLKVDLQDRIWEWTQQQHQKRVADRRTDTAIDMGLPLAGMHGSEQKHQHLPHNRNRNSRRKQSRGSGTGTNNKTNGTNNQTHSALAEYPHLEPLLNRRKAIRKEQREGKKITPESSTHTLNRPSSTTPAPNLKEYLAALSSAPPAQYSNIDIHNMYQAAKQADQVGDRHLSKTLLLKLKDATPNDARIFRRLARMDSEEGRVDVARKTLQEGLRLHPKNAFLWHGLGQLEVRGAVNNVDQARTCFKQAMLCDPSLPHPYHALGTLEHTHGKIAIAMNVFKEGLRYCPTNHRLHHALGDVYKEAKILDMAQRSYQNSLKYGSTVNYGFAFTALAHVAYEKGNTEESQRWLKKAVSLNRGRNSRAWIAWGQLEEAEGNMDAARAVYVEALAKYERGLIQRGQTQRRYLHNNYNNNNDDTNKNKSASAAPSKSMDPISLKNELLKAAPSYRSGDKFINVYRNWARLEERYGDADVVDEIYTRATLAFPRDYQLPMKWAQYHASKGHMQRASTLFEQACERSSNWHADPYRIYAEFLMSVGKYADAQSILYRGAQAMSISADGGLENHRGMAQLFHTWAVCEWHSDNLSRSEVLFDHALRLTDAGNDGSKIRSLVLFSIAQLEYFRDEYELAQHCVALCLKENVLPGGNSRIWSLWADIALAMENGSLAQKCLEQAEILKKDEETGGVESLGRLLELTRPASGAEPAGRSNGPAMQHLMRRDPWFDKIFGSNNIMGDLEGVSLPTKNFKKNSIQGKDDLLYATGKGGKP